MSIEKKEDLRTGKKMRRQRRVSMHQGKKNFSRVLEITAEVSVMIAIISSPLMLGSVHVPAVGIILFLSVLAFASISFSYFMKEKKIRLHPLIFLFFAIIFFEALQMVPLPPGMLEIISPRASEIAAFSLDGSHYIQRWRPISLDPVQTGLQLARHMSWLLLMAAISILALHRKVKRRLCNILGFTAVIAVVLALAHKLAGLDMIFGIYPAKPGGWLFGTFVNANHFAALLNLLVPVCLGLAFASVEKSKSALWGLAVILGGAVCLLTLSRGGMVGLVVGLTVFFALKRALNRLNADSALNDIPGTTSIIAERIFSGSFFRGLPGFFKRSAAVFNPVLLGGGAVAVGLYLAFDPVMAELATLTDHAQISDEVRWRIWEGALPFISDFPVQGAGAGAFATVYPMYRVVPGHITFSHAENQFVQAAAELGLPVTIIVVAFLFAFWLHIVFRCRPGPLEAGLLAGIAGLAVHEMTDFATSYGGVSVPAAAVLGLLIIYSSSAKARESSVSARARESSVSASARESSDSAKDREFSASARARESSYSSSARESSYSSSARESSGSAKARESSVKKERLHHLSLINKSRMINPVAGIFLAVIFGISGFILIDRSNKSGPDELLEEMVFRIEQGDDIEELLLYALNIRPSDYMLPLYAAKSFLDRGDLIRASKWINRAMYFSPADTRNHLLAAEIFARAGYETQAILQYRLAMEWGEREDRVLGIAALHYSSLEQIKRMLPEKPGAYSGAIRFLVRQRRHEDAWSFSKTAMKKFPEDIGIWLLGAGAASGLGMHKESGKLAQKVINADPVNARAYALAASSMTAGGDIEGGASILGEGLARLPGEPSLSLQLARLLIHNLKDIEGGLAVLDNMRLSSDERGRMHILRADAYRLSGQTRKAMDEYRTAAMLRPRDPGPWISMGDFYMQTDQWERALEAYREAALRRPGPAVDTRLRRAEKKVEDLYEFRQRKMIYGDGKTPLPVPGQRQLPEKGE